MHAHWQWEKTPTCFSIFGARVGVGTLGTTLPTGPLFFSMAGVEALVAGEARDVRVRELMEEMDPAIHTKLVSELRV